MTVTPGERLDVCTCEADLVHTVVMDQTGHGVARRLPIDLTPEQVDRSAEQFAADVAALLDREPGPARWSIRCAFCGTLHAFGRIV